MIDIWFTLIPILLTDIVNPVLFTFLVYGTSTKHPIINSTTILFGHTLAYFCVGVILALGLEQITERLANPQQIDFIIGLLIGILLLWVALRSRIKDQKSQAEDRGDLTVVKAFGLGAVVNFIGIPFALPYFAALDQILKADFTVTESLLVLGGYNILYPLPFVIVPVMVAILGERSRPLLQRINDSLDKFSSFLMPVLLVLVGLCLVIDAISYFVTGEGLF